MYITQTLHGDIEGVSIFDHGDFVVMLLHHEEHGDVSLFFHGKEGMDKVRRFHKQIGEAIEVAHTYKATGPLFLGEQGDGTFRVERSA